LIRKALKSTLSFYIPVTIAYIISSYLRFADKRKFWNQIAPHGEKEFWDSISPEVIELFAPDGVLPKMPVWNDYLIVTVVISSITFIVVFLICLLVAWFKNRQLKQEA